ncbi:SRPBCC family protein [Ornithinimicrobium sp. F0845]|uniref:SRPBCC family protein n=1 Tax=Ornithinimicrobium sp. F0845 TaxID=2926412 RepID=UPI001FF5E3D9|nr:SRPBCC family protein [Ornithinimicrobium sp. F0845]MCK0112006.1 SRPBCC family protein [Ornithinimicrobium sp. F0845]
MRENQQDTSTAMPAADPQAISRGLVSRPHDQGEAYVQTVAQTYATTVDDLWDAVTNVERLPRWFNAVSGDLRQGGRYQIEGNAGGTIQTCEAPRSFTATWEFGGNTSWIVVRISPEGEGARLELEHTALVPEDTTFWDEFGPGATGVGWDLTLMGLGAHVATGETITGDVAQGWETTPEGLAFISGSSRLWAEASVAFGTPPEAAEAAQARTTSFYTGQP